MGFFQRKYSYGIIAGSLLLTLAVFFYGLVILRDMENLRQSEIALFQNSQAIDRHLHAFQSALGFGGFIHNIKEFVVHRQPYQLYIIGANVRELEESFAALQTHFTDPASIRSIKILEEFVASVRQKYNVLGNVRAELYAPFELDDLLDIEEPRILSALLTLESLRDNSYEKAIAKTQASIDEIVGDLVIASVMLPLLLGIGGVLAWMLNQAIRAREELEKAQQLLAENEKLLEATGSAAKVGGWELDAETLKIKCTREVFHICGLPPEAGEIPCLERGLAFFPRQNRKKLEELMQQALATGQAFDLELPFVDNNGENHLVRIVCQSVAADGKVVKLRGAFQDITEARAMEERLRQAEKIDSIGNLAGGVAHDYNNMLSVIIGYTELALLKVSATDQLHEDLNQVLNAAKRSRDITQQLLAFARKQTLEPKVIDLNTTIEDTLKMLRRLIGENIDLHWQPAEHLPWVEIDPSQLNQILANLCVNARDAIEEIGTVTIATRKVTIEDGQNRETGLEPGAYVMIAVSDDGCGVEEKIKEKIFEPFFSTKPFGEGTGLGLATVYGAVKQSKGMITVNSEPGKGTTFEIYLPEYTGQLVSNGRKKPKGLPEGRKEKILVVEDEGMVLNLAKEILNGFGFETLTAASPSEALQITRREGNEISLLVTDVIMPEMNGRVLAERVQAEFPDLKCLYMSGYTENIIGDNGLLDKGTLFISKPFSREDFGRKVREALRR